MRAGIDATTQALYLTQGFDSHIRIRVENGDGTLIDLQDRFKAYRLEAPTPNLPIGALSVDFVRETALTSSLAPFVQASTYNRLDDGVTYNPLLQLGRLVTMDVALTTEGAARPGGGGFWYEVFRGTITSVKWPQRYGRTASISCTDMGGLLQKSKSEAEFTYTAGTAIETVVQQVLTNNGHTWVTLDVPLATGKVLPNDYAPGLQKTVWEQVAALAQSMGWLIWFKYQSASDLRLALFEPPRGKTVADQTVSVIHEFTDFGINESDIGNVGYVRYYDEDGVQQQVGPVEDGASIIAYGGSSGIRRTFWIVLAPDSPVRTLTDATDLLNAALADVADPDVLATVTLPPMWFADAAVDLYTFPTVDGRLFDVAQSAAPFSVTTEGQGNQPQTSTMALRGKPSSGAKSWAIVGGGEIITTGTGTGLSSIVLPDVLDSFVLGASVPYVTAGGPTDAFPRRAFTVHTTADLSDWSLGALFLQDVGNVVLHGPQGIENYMRFQNTATVAGPNLGFISNAEHAGSGDISGLKLYAGSLVINGSGNVTGTLSIFDASVVARVGGKTGVVSGKFVGFRGNIPSSNAAVTGTLWNAYMDGTAPNYFAGRTYFGSSTDTTYLERSTTMVLATGAQFAASSFAIGPTVVIDAAYVLQNVTISAALLTAGTLPDARLSANVAMLNAAAGQTFANAQKFTAFTRIGSQTSGAVLVVGDQSVTGANSLTSGVGQEIYADGNAVFTAFLFSNRSTGTSAGLGFLWGLTASAGGSPAKRAMAWQLQKTGTWDATTTNQNASFVTRLIRDGTLTDTLFLTSKANLGLNGNAFGGGEGAFFIANAITNVTSTPAGGSILWSAAGVLKTRSSVDALGGYYVNGQQVVTPTGTLAPGSVANAAAFAAALKPVEVWTYATLPSPGATDQVAFVTDWPLGGGPTGPRLARWNGSAWVAMVNTSELVGTITAAQITAGAINSTHLSASSVTAGAIAAGAVTATAINVATLSSIAANVGTLNAGLIQNGAGTMYIDLSAATSYFIQHPRLSLLHAGGAEFTGTVKLTVALGNSLEFWNGATQVATVSTTVFTAGSGFTAINFNFPGITRSLAVSAQAGNLLIENVDSTGAASASIGLGSTLILSASSGIMVGLGGAELAFYGLTPGVTKGAVAGSRGGNAALANLLSYLANRGLLTDSTT